MQHHHHDGNDEQDDDDDEVDLPPFILVDDAQCLVKIPSSNSDGDVGGGSHYYCNLPCPHCEKGENEGMRRKCFFFFHTMNYGVHRPPFWFNSLRSFT